MTPVIVSQTGSGTSRWVMFNPLVTPFQASLSVVVSGTVNYTVNYTYDDITGSIAPSSASPPVAWPVPALTTKTASLDTYIGPGANPSNAPGGPVYAVNLVVNSGTGTATLYAFQAGVRQS